MRKGENVKRRQSNTLSSLYVFAFLYFDREKSENTTDEIGIYDRIYVSYFLPPSVVFSLCCLENSHFRILRRRRENTIWRKSTTINFIEVLTWWQYFRHTNILRNIESIDKMALVKSSSGRLQYTKRQKPNIQESLIRP
jgi:hypothetical protein